MDKSDLIFATTLVLIFIPGAMACYIYIRYELRDPPTFVWRKATEPKIAYAFLAHVTRTILAGVALFFCLGENDANRHI
ncbi:hypothetical protein [Phyllobacterium zundukense]|uniref:Uncharacterized protein n=1 Tax=Phyllobacterium zundukense TaxID=1867719 RepID=A0ACD4CZ87_9HYPH|nr:hypothetical protein [Phyllobacterium zundukense]UXN58942.1 hypothetical protein N8E88_08555 [Phyllobacterium zundukense]